MKLFLLLLLLTGNETYTLGDFNYTLNNNSITLTGYYGNKETLQVPSNIMNLPVNTIAQGCFTDSPDTTTILLPDTITLIEQDAFLPQQIVIFSNEKDKEELEEVEETETEEVYATVSTCETKEIEPVTVTEIKTEDKAEDKAENKTEKTENKETVNIPQSTDKHISLSILLLPALILLTAGIVLTLI